MTGSDNLPFGTAVTKGTRVPRLLGPPDADPQSSAGIDLPRSARSPISEAVAAARQ